MTKEETEKKKQLEKYMDSWLWQIFLSWEFIVLTAFLTLFV